MGKKLFVGSLSWDTDDQKLKDAFASFGEIDDAVVIKERDTGRSRGFGFVTFVEDADAEAAIEKMEGTELDGRTIRVNEANERPPRRDFGGGGGGGGGRFNGGGGGGGFDNKKGNGPRGGKRKGSGRGDRDREW